jgi:hypothetical protein
VASFIYNSFWEDVAKGAIDCDTDTFWVMLIDSAGVAAANKDTHTKRSDVTGDITATGYTAGGKVCTVTVAKNTTTDRVTITFAAVDWTSFTGTSYGAVYYKRRGGASSADELVALNDFGGPVAISGTTMSIANSVITIQN